MIPLPDVTPAPVVANLKAFWLKGDAPAPPRGNPARPDMLAAVRP